MEKKTVTVEIDVSEIAERYLNIHGSLSVHRWDEMTRLHNQEYHTVEIRSMVSPDSFRVVHRNGPHEIKAVIIPFAWLFSMPTAFESMEQIGYRKAAQYLRGSALALDGVDPD